MKNGNAWWKNVNTDRSSTNETEEYSTELFLQNKTETTEKILKTYKEMMDKNSELMRNLMINFDIQAELLEKFLLV